MPTRYRGTEKEKRALNAMIALMRGVNALTARLAAGRARDGISLAQLAILEALLHCGPLCQKDLAGKLLVTGANMTKAVDLLEREGLAERRRDTRDRRYITVALTATGRRKISSVFPRHVGDIVEAFEVLSAREQETLRTICRKLGTGMKERRKT